MGEDECSASLFVGLLHRQSGRAVSHPQALQTQEKKTATGRQPLDIAPGLAGGKNCCSLVYAPVTRGATTAAASRLAASAAAIAVIVSI